MKKLRKKMYLFLTFLLVFISLAIARSLREDLNLSLEEKRIEDLSAAGLFLVFYVNISNSSSSPYYLTSYDYRFVVNQKEYLRLSNSLEEDIKIEAKGDTLLSLPLRISYDYLFRVVEGIKKDDKAQCYLTGAMNFRDVREEKGRLPFAFSGEFPIFKKPEIKFISLQVKELTIGGADLNFEMSFKNSNIFELLVDKISYSIHLAEKPIREGMISGDKNMESGGEKVFSIPLLLNFFEVGKEVYSKLHESSVLCRFSGEIEVRTIWGRIKIPFSKNEKVVISRNS